MITFREPGLRVGGCIHRSPHASNIFLQAMRLIALIGMAAVASSSVAEEFQEHGPGLDQFNGVLSPKRITTIIEADARKTQDPYDSNIYNVLFAAENAEEYAALAHYSLLVMTVVTQKPQELPIKNLYIRAGGQRIPLARISRWQVDVDPRLATHKIFGPYREDAFYLFPTGALFRIGQLQVDLGARRTGVPALEMPPQWIPKHVRSFPRDEPPPSAIPNLRALQNLIRRKTAGFAIPDALPAVAELGPPAPEPTKPTALKDLFKK